MQDAISPERNIGSSLLCQIGPLFGLLVATAPLSLFLQNLTLLIMRRKVNNQDVHQT
jgi:hypothetical protein